MRRGDDAGFGIGEQDRRTIRGEHAEGNPGDIGHGAISMRVVFASPWPLDHHDLGAMNLVARHELLGSETEFGGRDRPVAGDGFQIVPRAETAIERGE